MSMRSIYTAVVTFVYCTGPAGDGPPGPTYTAHVRHERPGKPDLK